MRKAILACVVTALVVGVGTATAAKLITSGDVKNNTLKSPDFKNGGIKKEDIKKGTITRDRLNQQVKAQLFAASGHWGVIDRNTIGSPSASLRSGPATPEIAGPPPSIPAQAPPFGTGSLNLIVSGAPTVPAGQEEKVAYGNEFDFVGDSFADVTAVGFHLYTTPENISGGGTGNLPSITFEVDPNLTGVGDNFASLVFFPEPILLPLVWSDYIDATTTGLWGGTGDGFTGTPCDIDGARCTFAELQDQLDDGGDPPLIGSVAITKGRDNSFQGAVDGLRINDTVYDFEETGVLERTPQ